MQPPKVAVIIPCYNLGQYLDDAVDSVLAQTFSDYEILIVDDGSTDESTRRLLANYRKPRTRVLRSENKGLPAAKNLGLANTAGGYVCMFDADDRLEKTFLEKSVAVLDAEPDIAFVSHWVRTFGDEERDWTPTDCSFPALLDMNTVNGAALVRRSALESAGRFDETMRDGCEDWDIWISLVERGLRGKILTEVLFHYRRRPQSMSRVMLSGVGHPHLYRFLAQKHAATFAVHATALLARREEDMSNLRRHTHDLDLEHHDRLGPELAKWRDDVAVLERKVAKIAAEREQEERYAAEIKRLQSEVAALRTSISWKLTAPLRSVYETARRLLGTRA
jgi:glycosyltransferase involved in cell wall biosynthesis